MGVPFYDYTWYNYEQIMKRSSHHGILSALYQHVQKLCDFFWSYPPQRLLDGRPRELSD